MTRVLVVEDDAPLREWLAMTLRRNGYEVRLAAGGAEGLQLLAAEPCDALVLDLLMPQMSGFEVLTAMEEKGLRVPTVITSGIVIPGVHDYLKTHPQVQLLSKPYTEEQICDHLQSLVQKQKKPTGRRNA